MNREHLTRTLTGTVISDKMNKTITVKVQRTVRHHIYDRVVKKTQKYKAHDEENKAKIGDSVKIAMTRPLSKTKRWRLLEVLK